MHPSGTDDCERCDSEISVFVEECPECGYAPSEALAPRAIGGVAAAVLLVTVPTVVVAVAGQHVGVGVGLPAGTVLAFGVPVACHAAAMVYAARRQDRRTPTDSTVFRRV